MNSSCTQTFIELFQTRMAFFYYYSAWDSFSGEFLCLKLFGNNESHIFMEGFGEIIDLACSIFYEKPFNSYCCNSSMRHGGLDACFPVRKEMESSVMVQGYKDRFEVRFNFKVPRTFFRRAARIK